jgi:predicted transposase YdaD
MGTIADMLREEGYEKGVEKGVLLGEQKGIEKGVLLGEQKGFILARQEIAIKLLKTTDNLEFIAKVTGLAPEEIRKLQTTVH